MTRSRRARPATGPSTESSDNEQQERRGRSRSTRPVLSQITTDERRALRSANASRDAALNKLTREDNTTTTTTTATTQSSNNGGTEEGESSVEVGRRALETPSHPGDTTGFDLGDSLFGDLDDSFGDGELPSALQLQSVDSSSLSLGNYRARSRSRQSTIVGRNDTIIRPSSRGTNTPGVSTSFSIGLFKRRAREPSILGTSRKPRATPSGAGHASEVEDDAAQQEDIVLEGESTPSRRHTGGEAAADPGSPSPSRSPLPARRSTRSSLKRKSQDGPGVEEDRPGKSARPSAPTGDGLVIDSDSELSSIGSPQLPVPRNLMERPVTPSPMDDSVAAPPMSSDSESDGEMWPDIQGLAKRRRRPSPSAPPRGDAFSDISSPPSLTHSPNYKEQEEKKSRGKTTRKCAEGPGLTTADLANLLPKRHYKRRAERAEMDVEAGNEAPDHDDAEFIRRRPARPRKPKPSKVTSQAPGRTEEVITAAAAAPLEQTDKQGRATRASARRQTYSRRSSDKENDSGGEDEVETSMFQAMPDDTFDSVPVETVAASGKEPLPEELKKAASKFQDVDQWDLEYEEVQRPSSPFGAR